MTHAFYSPAFAETTAEFRPTETYVEGDPKAQYWTKYGVVHFHDHVVAGSDSTSFRFYISGLAADRHRSFLNGRVCRFLDPTSLRALSFAYHCDERSVRTNTAEVKGADVSTFMALDRGIRTIPGGVFPHILIASGYAKDKNRAYFCDDGNAMPVVKADPASFEVLAESFAGDERSVFWGRASLPKADRPNWQRLAGAFSTDGTRVYSRNYIVEGADPSTFVVYPDRLDGFSYARDKNFFYGGHHKISSSEFERGVGDG
jgi:hypothetical protein